MSPAEVLASHTSYHLQEWQAWFILRDAKEGLDTEVEEQKGKVASARRR